MRIPTRTQDRGFAFNITPLIDVVFLLIIFFLVASHFIRNEHVEQIELPRASEGRDEDDAAHRLVVTIVPGGQLLLGSTVISEDDLEQRLQQLIAKQGPTETELRIRADRSVEFMNVEPLLLVAARNGVTRVRFSVLTE